MKIFKNLVETTNTGVVLQKCWHHVVVMPFEKTPFLTSKRFSKMYIVKKPCIQYPMLTLHFAGLRVDNNKGVIVKSWNIVGGN